METKKRKFSRKLIALFLAVLMAFTSFTGAISAFAADSALEKAKNYHDDNLAANFMAWAETTDEQTAEALLDWVDLNLDKLILGLGAHGVLEGDHLYIHQNAVVTTIHLDSYLDSVDGLLWLIDQADALLAGIGGLAGDAGDIHLGAINDMTPVDTFATSKCGKSYREAYSAKYIITRLAKILYENSHDNGNNEANIFGRLLRGELNLGVIVNAILPSGIYGALQEPLGLWDGYEKDMIYNIVSNLIISNVDWFTEEEKAAFMADLKDTSKNGPWNIDDQLLKALNKNLLQEINVLVTYGTRYTLEDGSTHQETSYTRNLASHGVKNGSQGVQNDKLVYYQGNLDDDGIAKNVYLFQYDFDGNGAISDSEKLTLDKNDNLFSFAFRALKFAWYTVLKDTVSTVHVNSDVDRGHGANFDNAYYYWASKEFGWNRTDWKSNYKATQVQAWAQAVYADYNAKSADEFLGYVKETYTYTRNVEEGSEGAWDDIDSTTLFGRLRYNPLADLYFNMPTGPINLYFEQTGIDSLSTFFDTAFDDYNDMIDGLNNALVAALGDFFPYSKNIGYTTADGQFIDLKLPEYATTTRGVANADIAKTIVNNAVKVFEYAANATDANLLYAYYNNHGIDINTAITKYNTLSEANFEEAMIPFLIACLQNIKMLDVFHPEKWDSCKDAEGVAIVALEEYLSNILPDKDYTVLWDYDANGKIVATTKKSFDQDNDGDTDLLDAVLIMARDAASFWVQSLIPCRDKNWREWNVYDRAVLDTTTIFDILNSVVVYYASDETFSDDNTVGRGVASLLGAVNGDGTCKVNKSNDLWQNVDAIGNKFFPIVGIFQYGNMASKGKFNSKDLIWNDLVGGILEIGADHSNGMKGVTNILNRILTIISADPIKNNGGNGRNIIQMIYDELVCELINNLLGARYTGQSYATVIPTSDFYDSDNFSDTASATPFDSLLRIHIFGSYPSKKSVSGHSSETPGVLGILINNLYEFLGCDSKYKNLKGVQATWNGLMFAVTAVNSFIPSFVPQLTEHKFNAITATIDNASQSGLNEGDSLDTTMHIKNNSIGLNRFYRNASGKLEQSGRYFIGIKGITYESNDGLEDNVEITLLDTIIAPEKNVEVPLFVWEVPEEGATYTFNIRYAVYKAKDSDVIDGAIDDSLLVPGMENLTATTYMYLSPDKGWEDLVYEGSDNLGFNAVETGNTANDVAYATVDGSGNTVVASFPKDFIVPTVDTASVTSKTFHVWNFSSGNSGFAGGMVSYLLKGTQYYAVNGSTVASSLTTANADNRGIAYATFDSKTGDLLNYDRFDYFVNGAWNRGSAVNGATPASGFSQDDIDGLDKSIREADDFRTRTHIAFTFDEACAAGIVKGVQKSGDTFKAVMVTPTTALTAGGAGSITWATSVPGLHFATKATNMDSGAKLDLRLFDYDGEGDLEVGTYPMGIMIVDSNGSMYSENWKTNMHVTDNSVTTTLYNAYVDALGIASTYTPDDMTDVNSNHRSRIYTALQTALSRTIQTLSTPITVENATKLTTEKADVVDTWETNERLNGDAAYVPVSTSVTLPEGIKAYAKNGFWYADPACTAVIYSNRKLTSANDPSGAAVEYNAEEDKYHLVNGICYDKVWDTTTYATPYLVDSDEQKENNGSKVYNQIYYRYYDAEGNELGVSDDETDKWTYKIPGLKSVNKPNDGTDYRSIYDQDMDNMNYNLEQVYANVNSKFASTIGVDVVEKINGMENINYDVAAFDKMKRVADYANGLIQTKYTDVLKADHSVVVTLSPDSTLLNTLYVDKNGNVYKDSEVERIVVEGDAYTTTRSSLEINAAKLMFDEVYKNAMTLHRSYKDRPALGSKLEAEITCASGNAYDKYSVTENPEEGIMISTTAQTVKFGKLDNGILVNDGYTEQSWGDYLRALSDAVIMAQEGHDGDEEYAEVSELYATKAALQRAENKLTIDEGETTITVSGIVTIATNLEGGEPSFTSEGYGIEGMYVEAAGVSVLTNADGKFSIELPIGTTEITVSVSADSVIKRTVTISGDTSVEDVIVPIVVCDYSNDGLFNGSDTGTFVEGFAEYKQIYDLNLDGIVNGTDIGLYAGFLAQTVEYDELAY